MGGKGSGGKRPGSGRKPKAAHLRAIDGGAGHRPVVPVAPAPDLSAVVTFAAPVGLDPSTQAVWESLAPHAFRARTLTRATEYAFLLLCRNVVLEGRLSQVEPGGPSHRALMQRVESELLRFDLSPNGKPLYEPVVQAPANPLDRFLARRREA